MGLQRVSFVFCLVLLISDSRCSEHNSDQYISSSKAECFSSKKLFSCIKYKTAHFIWSVAIGRIQLNENLLNSEHVHLVRIENDGMDVEFSEYRHDQDVSQTSKALSFLKRSVHMFLAAHGFRISFENDIGARPSDSHSNESAAEARGRRRRRRRKRRLKLVLPLLIIVKMIAILLSIGGIKLLLVGGGLFMFQYFRNCALNNTRDTSQDTSQCRPRMETMRSSMVDSEPEPSYASYAYRYHDSPSYGSSASSTNHLANNRAYSAYSAYNMGS